MWIAGRIGKPCASRVVDYYRMDSEGSEARSFVGYRRRCVLLARPGGLSDLIDTLTTKGLDIRRCDSVYLVMAELVLHEAARRSGWHADAAILVIAEPDRIAELPRLLKACRKWAPQTVIQTYSTKQEPRLQAYEAGLPMDDAPQASEPPKVVLPRTPEVVVRPRPATSPPAPAAPTKLRLAGEAGHRARSLREAPAARHEGGTPIHAPTESPPPAESNPGDTLILSEAELSMLLSPQWKFSKPDRKP